VRLAASVTTGLLLSGKCNATRVISNATFAMRVRSGVKLLSLRNDAMDKGAPSIHRATHSVPQLHSVSQYGDPSEFPPVNIEHNL
jgi:hypothetical protein